MITWDKEALKEMLKDANKAMVIQKVLLVISLLAAVAILVGAIWTIRMSREAPHLSRPAESTSLEH